METWLVFHEGFELPCFASFPLLESSEGRAALDAYFEPYLALARWYALGFVLEAATWRTNPAWGGKRLVLSRGPFSGLASLTGPCHIDGGPSLTLRKEGRLGLFDKVRGEPHTQPSVTRFQPGLRRPEEQASGQSLVRRRWVVSSSLV